jgi:hypothetical protein
MQSQQEILKELDGITIIPDADTLIHVLTLHLIATEGRFDSAQDRAAAIVKHMPLTFLVEPPKPAQPVEPVGIGWPWP